MEPDNNNQRRIVLIGGTGFLGNHFLTTLLSAQYPNIAVVSRSEVKQQHSKVEYIQANFSNNEAMQTAIREGDIVVHFACTTIPSTSELDSATDMKENVLGTSALLDACRTKKIHKFIFISSGGTVYGDYGTKKISETDVCKPISAHGRMKLLIEENIQRWHNEHQIPFVIVRPANVYGRPLNKDRAQGAIEVFLRKILHNEPIVVWGDGTIARDYLYVDDFSKFLLLTLGSGVHGVYNVGSGVGTTLNDLIREIERTTGIIANVEYRVARAFDVPRVVLETSRAQEELGWSPAHQLSDGLRLFYQQINRQK